MKKISDLLSKFKNLEHPDAKKEIISKEIKRLTNLDIEKEHLDLRGKKLFIKTDGYIKSEVFLRKEEILLAINKKLGDYKIDTII